MFQRRLKIFIGFWLIALAILAARLVWLQIIDAPKYASEAGKLLERSPRWLETVRGTIYDCKGRPLARDAGSYQICLSYKLMRFYDERFWQYQRLAYRQKHKSKTIKEQNQYINEKYLPKYRESQKLLAELAKICQVKTTEIVTKIHKINQNIYILRANRARRKWYRDHKLPVVPVKNAQGVVEDLQRIVPDKNERLARIYQLDVLEMTIPQPVLTVSRNQAFAVEDRLVGQSLMGGRLPYQATNKADRPIMVTINKIRKYPWHSAACHILGQMGPVLKPKSRPRTVPPTVQDLSDYYLGDRRGAWGIEKLFENRLRGRRGWEQRNKEGKVITRIDPVYGHNVKLTIDIKLQKAVQDILNGNNDTKQRYHAAAVVIDVDTAGILAMVSTPGFDLDKYYLKDQYKLVNNPADPDKRITNRALSVNYQTGSTIKPSMLMGILQAGLINENTIFDCDKANVWWQGPPYDIENHGPVSPIEAVQHSCNFFFIKVATLMGPARTVNWLHTVGFGRRILAWPATVSPARAISSFHETPGHVCPIGRTIPSEFDLRFIGIGRGALDGSVLQMANSAATIARNGIFINPRLIITPACPVKRIALASANNIDIVQRAMYAVINKPGGTAYQAFEPLPWDENVVKLYGKTGTTDNSIFICYARPAAGLGRCIAIAVLAEVNEHGSAVAAPLTRRILLALADYNYLPVPAAQPEIINRNDSN